MRNIQALLTNKIKAVVFDCDGVMFDTAEVNRLYYNRLLAGFNKPPLTETQFVNVHMFSVKDAIAYLFPEREDLTDVFDRMKALAYGEFITHMVIEPGLKDFLDGLKKSAFIRAVATNRTNTMAEVLRTFDLEHRFESVVTAADVKNPKPAPDQLLKIMDQFNWPPKKFCLSGIQSLIKWRQPELGLFYSVQQHFAQG